MSQPKPSPRRRVTDRGWRSWGHVARDFWTLAISVLVLVAIYYATEAGDSAVNASKQAVQATKDNRRAIAQIQVERRANTLRVCREANRQNAAIRGFIRAAVPRLRRENPAVIRYLHRADTTFPARDCEAEARARVKRAP